MYCKIKKEWLKFFLTLWTYVYDQNIKILLTLIIKINSQIMNQDHQFHEMQFSNNQHIKQHKSINSNQIEPWMDEPQTIPLYLLKTQTEKFVPKPPKLRKYASLQIHIKHSSISPRRQSRPSKQLPKKNIGNFTIVKLSQQESKSRQLVKKKRKSQVSLPTLSVARELAIQRKLFLMKKNEQSPSPKRKSIRGIVDSQFHK